MDTLHRATKKYALDFIAFYGINISPVIGEIYPGSGSKSLAQARRVSAPEAVK